MKLDIVQFLGKVTQLKKTCDRILQVCGKLSWAPEIRTESKLNDTSLDLYKTIFSHDIKFHDSSMPYDYIWWAADIVNLAEQFKTLFSANDWAHYNNLKNKSDAEYEYTKDTQWPTWEEKWGKK